MQRPARFMCIVTLQGVVNTEGSKTFTPPASCFPYRELAAVWQTIEQVGRFDATTTPVL